MAKTKTTSEVKSSEVSAKSATAKKATTAKHGPDPVCPIAGPHPFEQCAKYNKEATAAKTAAAAASAKANKFAAPAAAVPERASSKAMRDGAKAQAKAEKKTAKPNGFRLGRFQLSANGTGRTNRPRIGADVVFSAVPDKVDEKLQKKLDNKEVNSHGVVVLRYLLEKEKAKFGKLVADVVASGKYNTAGNAETLILGDLRIMQANGLVVSDEAAAQ